MVRTAKQRVAGGRRRRCFNMGCDTIHMDEIDMARRMRDACVMLYGEEQCRRKASKSPASLFRRLRYGRFVDSHCRGRKSSLVFVSDNSPHQGQYQATDADVLTPLSPDWNRFRSRVRRIVLSSRWADGWSASAEALDAMGYAVAESIAAIQLFGFDEDEGVLHGPTC